MEEIKSNLKSRIKNIIFNPIYIVFLITFSVVWGVIFAENISSTTSTTINYIPYIPSTPTDLSLSSNSDISTTMSISIKWKDNANNEDKFNIERKLSSETIWSTLTQIQQSNTTSYTDTLVTAGVAYDYRVQACLSNYGCSGYIYLYKVVSGVATTPVYNTTLIQPTITTGTTNITLPIIPTPTPTSATESIMPSTLITQTVEPREVPQTIISVVATNEFSSKIQDLGLVVEERQKAVDDSKEQLVRIINKSVVDIIKDDKTSRQKTDTAKINILRDELLKNVDSSLPTPTIVTSTDINNLKTEINKRIEDIKSTTAGNVTISTTNDTNLKDIAYTLDLLSESISNQSETLKKREADLLYKDSNEDGISDYDSIYIYNINPNQPSQVSIYEGKSISASDKILLGLDPTKSEVVKVNKEQPLESKALVVLTYKVKEVTLTEKKEVVITGQALPNSFITLYIYSTPIIVTVKTDSRGEWRYVLDKELENGDHTIYTATVNNSGNIIAKSSGYLFTKTAEAATLKDIPTVGASADTNKPGLLEGNNLYIIITMAIIIIMMILIIIGITSKKIKII